MPHDKNGFALATGDRVTLTAKVKDVSVGEDACNLTLEVDNAAGEAYEPVLAMNSRGVTKVCDAAGVAVPPMMGAAPRPEGSPGQLAQGLINAVSMPGSPATGSLIQKILGASNSWDTVRKILDLLYTHGGDIQKLIDALTVLWNVVRPQPTPAPAAEESPR